MSWFDKNDYNFIARIEGDIDARTNRIHSFTKTSGSEQDLLAILKKFMDELEKQKELIEIKFVPDKDDGPRVYGRPMMAYPFFAEFFVAKEDADKIGQDVPIKIMLKTNLFPNSEDLFKGFFKDLSSFLG